MKETLNNINPEFLNIFSNELESIDIKEKKMQYKENTNNNIVLFISKKEIKTIKKLLNLVDNIIVNSKK